MARLHRAQLLLLFIEPLSCCCCSAAAAVWPATSLSGIAAAGMRLLLKVRQEVPYDHGSKGKRMQALAPDEKARNARIASSRQVQCLRMDLLP